MNPMWGAAAMSCSSVFVVCNALRLNLFDMHSARRDRKIKHPVKTDANGFVLEHKENTEVEEKNSGKDDMMTKTIKIDGMMCGHCEATVKKALEALDGVESAQVSHTAGQAVVELSKDVDNDVLTKAVEDKDYKVTAIQ
jgi:Cu2+-exporting ATPase